jgi:hypothetical protein
MKARTANYPDLVQEAEKAVQGVKDAELKRIAFQKVLEELLSGGGAEKRSTSKRARSGKPSRANDTPRGGPKAYIIELIDEGYFKKPKGMADLKVELENRGHHIPRTSLSGPLQDLCKARKLRRSKADGGRFVYSNW